MHQTYRLANILLSAVLLSAMTLVMSPTALAYDNCGDDGYDMSCDVDCGAGDDISIIGEGSDSDGWVNGSCQGATADCGFEQTTETLNAVLDRLDVQPLDQGAAYACSSSGGPSDQGGDGSCTGNSGGGSDGRITCVTGTTGAGMLALAQVVMDSPDCSLLTGASSLGITSLVVKSIDASGPTGVLLIYRNGVCQQA